MEAKERHAVAAIALLASVGVGASALAQTTPNERKASALSAQWRNHSNSITYGPDGSVVFVFGQSQPSVVCAPLSLCEIQLQPGETVKDVFVGDTVRWKVEPATSGTGGNQRISVIVKPNDPNLSTNMVITTSRRVYHIALKSSLRNYMARVSFAYPDDTANLNDANNRLVLGSGAVDGSGGVYPEKLNFAYRVSGDNPSWKPIRVYNDGTKTYIHTVSRICWRRCTSALCRIRRALQSRAEGRELSSRWRHDGRRFAVRQSCLGVRRRFLWADESFNRALRRVMVLRFGALFGCILTVLLCEGCAHESRFLGRQRAPTGAK